MIKQALAALILVPALVSATEIGPWLSRDFELENRFSILHQAYRKINADTHDIHKSANDNFYTVGTALTVFDYNADIEATLADTRKQRPAFDNANLTLRWRILNDIVGDPVTLTPGITITQACKHSLHDISSFHHGQIEGELHVAVGKEVSCEELWLYRIWGVGGFGVGDHGSPWLHADFNIDRNWQDIVQLRLFIHTLWGMGNNNLSTYHDFHGYGPIRHKSIDVGLRAWYQLPIGLTLSLEYAYRVYAQNFPEHTNLALFSIHYPVGL